MKLVRFESDGEAVIGIVSGTRIIRIAGLLPEYRKMRELAAAGPMPWRRRSPNGLPAPAPPTRK